mmetsp:Transcript_19935/g.63402  ORF Transcript_19935/g.63402 Transcript_19935/m.63402 type:complete len:344 (+) Transcript_19935:1-1032(+)
MRGAANAVRRLSTAKRVPGVVFDIDGVLLRGKIPVPGAGAVLCHLRENGIPFVLLTNGGGVSEAEKAAVVTKRLECSFDLRAEEIVQVHTPLQAFAEHHRGQRVLVLGKRYPKLKAVMEGYGFGAEGGEVLTADVFHAQHPSLYRDMEPEMEEPGLDERPIRGVFALTDPIAWGRELQIACDVLRSNGTIGDMVDSQIVPFYNCCSDFEYQSDFHLPRFGAGAFTFALRALYKELTGRHLREVQLGKPHEVSFDWAEHVLRDQAHELHGKEVDVGPVFMVGDNPLTDILGASMRGSNWVPVLTRSGMFTGPDDAGKAAGAKHIIDSVKALPELIRAESSEGSV